MNTVYLLTKDSYADRPFGPVINDAAVARGLGFDSRAG